MNQTQSDKYSNHSKQKRIFTWIRFVFLFFLFLFLYRRFFPAHSGPKPGSTAPSLTLQSVTSQKKWQPSFTSNVTLLHFWASWCRGCMQTLAHSTQRAKALQQKGVQYLLINVDQDLSANKLQRFLRQKGFPSETLAFHHRDVFHQGSTRYNIRFLPTIVMIDRFGKILKFNSGYVDDKTLNDWQTNVR